MTEEKQKIISDICPFYKEYGSCDRCNTDLDIDDPPCYFECMANAIINNGYRKQTEGEWESFPSLGTAYRCSVCKDKAENKSKFCPNCGAKMRGSKVRGDTE